MDNRDWVNLGNDIRDMVEDAVNSQNFHQLNENIRNTVATGLDSLERGFRTGFGGQNRPGGFGQPWGPEFGPNGEPLYGEGPGPEGGPEWQAGPGPQADPRQQGPRGGFGPGYAPGRQYRRERYPRQRYGNGQMPASRPNSNVGQWKNTYQQVKNVLPGLFANMFGPKAGGTALLVTGIVMTASLGMASFILLLIGLLDTWLMGYSISLGIMLPLMAVGIWMICKGGSALGKVNRFQRYIKALGGRTYCGIKELAQSIGKNERFVLEDLRKMIHKGWFRQGHLDKQGTCLIVSNDVYKQYLLTEQQAEQRQLEEQKKQKEMKEKGGEALSEALKEVIDTGSEYLDKIRKSNQAIPDVQITEKISRMETIIERIFQRVKEHPENVDDLHKFMDYYLPMTVKLLDAYEELNGQPVQGENIRNSKKEIQDTLDTLNQAFEKLLDDLFEDTAWDVSTDISVLQNMLAQEGLTEQALKADK